MDAIELDAVSSIPLVPVMLPADLLRSAVLRRLRRLLTIRYRACRFLDDTDIRLLDRSIYSTFCDCLDAALGAEARHLLEEVRADASARLVETTSEAGNRI